MMKPEAQRIAIAEACGWMEIKDDDFSEYGVPCFILMGIAPRGSGLRTALHNYLKDLNAMHEAENNLDGMNKAEFAVQLCRVAGKDWPNGIGGGSFTHIHATAAQRAEAFLRAIGKWEGE